MTKDEIRSRLLAVRNNLSANEKSLYDKRMQEMLYSNIYYKMCSRLLCFVSFKSEPDTHEIIKHSLASGKKVYVPRVDSQDMEFYQIQNLDGLIPGRFGIAEPKPDKVKLFSVQSITGDFEEPDKANLMLLPGLAFDYRGYRIGYGGGYYDRYLMSHKHVSFYKIAFAYDFQLVDNIDADAYDIPVDLIITPTRIIKTGYCLHQEL